MRNVKTLCVGRANYNLWSFHTRSMVTAIIIIGLPISSNISKYKLIYYCIIIIKPLARST